ncbi:hypothetical protein [Actinoallomurus sp. NPDC050550]|uniref:hypothetical protein n=1 Tax=Actinoallomurus sp. NPDC050550 TaxID=3154937 RepID=UPI0033FA097F
MNVEDVVVGLGLDLYGIAFCAACRWYVRDDGRMKRMAESRWWLDRRVVRRVRRGEITRDEWFARFIRQQRALVSWGVTSVIALWLVGCSGLIVRGLGR